MNCVQIQLQLNGCKVMEKVLKICFRHNFERHLSMPFYLGMGKTNFGLEFGVGNTMGPHSIPT
jgi:hypothetical protein